MTPNNYFEYIIACLNDIPTDELQLVYTWLGKSRPEFKLRGVIRRAIENRGSKSKTELKFDESRYLDSMAEAGVRDNTDWCHNY
jgi:hypothetical protein